MSENKDGKQKEQEEGKETTPPEPKDADQGGQPGAAGAEGHAEPFAIFPDAASFNARMIREAKKELKAQAEALGFPSVDAMQVAIKEMQASQEAEKTELEKANEKIVDLEKKNTAARANTGGSIYSNPFRLVMTPQNEAASNRLLKAAIQAAFWLSSSLNNVCTARKLIGMSNTPKRAVVARCTRILVPKSWNAPASKYI